MREFLINLVEGYSTEYKGDSIIKTPIRDVPRRPPSRAIRIVTMILLPPLAPVVLITRAFVPPGRRNMGRK